MKLIPKTPPGRPNRKLLAHLDEIKRLRTEGYSVAVIHQTLIEAGIQVGLSTVFLEISKLKGPVSHPAPAVTGSVLPTWGRLRKRKIKHAKPVAAVATA